MKQEDTKKIKDFIARNRKICWESEFENGQECLGENIVLTELLKFQSELDRLAKENGELKEKVIWYSRQHDQDDATINQLRAEIKRMEDENFGLATHQCKYPNSDDGGTPFCEEVERLKAEKQEMEKEREQLRTHVDKRMNQLRSTDFQDLKDNQLMLDVAKIEVNGKIHELTIIDGLLSKGKQKDNPVP